MFERLYELRGQLEREGEAFDLVVGDGVLDWPRLDGAINHPILLQHVDLRFDTDGARPAFTVVETERGPELYTALLQSLSELEPNAVQRWRSALDEENYHPLGGPATSGFLRHIAVQLTAHGTFVEDGPISGSPDRPCIGREPVLFLRNRAQGFASAIDRVLEDIAQRDEVPAALVRIAGIETDDGQTALSGDSGELEFHEDAEDVLLSKPANPEQVRIIRHLEGTSGVLVQGPPGTGKSHTIANLLGHLLARKKSVLVTAHTTKALRVLRGYVAEALQPLCVSILDNDVDGRRELERSVDGIIARLSESGAGRLDAQAAALSTERRALIERIRATRQTVIDVRAGEYRPVVIGGESIAPSDAARRVVRERTEHGWIPGHVASGTAAPLSDVELADLYRTNATVSATDEQQLASEIPDPAMLPTPPKFSALVTERQELADTDRDFAAGFWDSSASTNCSELDALSQLIERGVRALGDGEPWRLAVIAAAQRGNAHRAPWDELLRLIDELGGVAAVAQETLIRFGPSLPSDTNLDEINEVGRQIREHLERGGTLGRLALLTRPAWRRVLAVARVGNGEPRLPEHFDALSTLATLRKKRKDLVERWGRQMGQYAVDPLSPDDPQLEQTLEQWAAHIRESLEWHTATWVPVEQGLAAIGFRWAEFLAAQPVKAGAAGDLLRVRDTATGALVEALAARQRTIRWSTIDGTLRSIRDTVAGHGLADSRPIVARDLHDALLSLNTTAYGDAFRRLAGLHSLRSDTKRRWELLRRLESAAPNWAAAIRLRQAPHDAPSPPGSLRDAWIWRQLNDELDIRGRQSLHDFEQELEALTRRLREVTADLIDCSAWAAQGARTTLRQQQALMGWAQTVRRLGRGTGRYAAKLRHEAARLMNDCRIAVPVWIMPLARVAEQFDPRETRFDVVIIDEASQSDVMALLACYLGDKVVVVGDHEQVSPLAVGQDLDFVNRLIATHLRSIPNNHLYDGRMSIYDLGRQAFGQPIMLVEHFRSVPDIIQFSNGLCYDWKIRPLRDGGAVRLKPHVVPYRVEATGPAAELNVDEARTIVSLIAAAVEQPEYAGKTFGVVTLVGDAQAIEIEKQLRTRLDVGELNRRRILCGNAAHFQGDERDVMFLSMVDTPAALPLPVRRDDRFKQRYNVAASRARDQMWVVHSVDPRLHLKAGDLRRELLEHAEDPSSRTQHLRQAVRRAESPLEVEVIKRLVAQGYRVLPQWQVGHYRIDIVVEGSGRRLAIECDGDRFHPIEKLAEDLERQAILERLEWAFVRVRGTQFYRNPDGALEPVFAKLEALGIPREGGHGVPHVPVGNRELLDRVVRRAEELRREWLEQHSAPWAGTETYEPPPGEDVASIESEERVLDILRLANGPLRKADIMVRAALSESLWFTTITNLRRRGLVVQEGTRRGAAYRLP